MGSTGSSPSDPKPPAGKGPPEWLYCTKHKKFHPRDDFYDNPRSKWGKSTWCKQAMSTRNKRLRYQQKNYTSPETLARRAVQNALKKGLLVKPAVCKDIHVRDIDCTGARLEFHHTGSKAIPDPYDPRNWLVGIFVCHSHHNIREGKGVDDPEPTEEEENDGPDTSTSTDGDGSDSPV